MEYFFNSRPNKVFDYYDVINIHVGVYNNIDAMHTVGTFFIRKI